MKFKSLVLLFICFCISIFSSLYAQTIDSTTNKTNTPWDFTKSAPPRGTFESFLHFKYNIPRETDFQIRYNSKAKSPAYYPYTSNGIRKIRNVFAMSNGKQIYLRRQESNGFIKIDSIGFRYSYQLEERVLSVGVTTPLPSTPFEVGLGVGLPLGNIGYVFDMELGTIKRLNDKYMKFILQEFPILWKDYKNRTFEHLEQKEEFKKYLIDVLNKEYYNRWSEFNKQNG